MIFSFIVTKIQIFSETAKDLYIRFDEWRSFLDIVEIDTEGIKQRKIDDVAIACYGNQLAISGVAKGTSIIVYDSAGRQIGTAKASDGVTIIDSSLKKSYSNRLTMEEQIKLENT